MYQVTRSLGKLRPIHTQSVAEIYKFGGLTRVQSILSPTVYSVPHCLQCIAVASDNVPCLCWLKDIVSANSIIGPHQLLCLCRNSIIKIRLALHENHSSWVGYTILSSYLRISEVKGHVWSIHMRTNNLHFVWICFETKKQAGYHHTLFEANVPCSSPKQWENERCLVLSFIIHSYRI